jgi:two-component system NtrC family response regulator
MQKLKIMVIDDEVCIRESFAWFLEDLGHEVHTAASPQVCRVYRGHDCDKDEACADALLIDHNMPGMNGLEGLAAMRAATPGTRTPGSG